MTPPAILPTDGISQLIPLASIPTDEDSQARIHIRPAVVRGYARAMTQQVGEGGLRFPPVVLFSDGQRFWLADGFHRILAAREAGLVEFPADVRAGNARDALLCSLSANAGHGLPRSNADKRKAVSLLLADPEWSQWSDHEIARHCQVTHVFVGKVRKGLSGNGYQIESRKVKRGDAVYEMQARSADDDKPDVQTTSSRVPVCDGLGLPLQADVAAVFTSVGDFQTAQALLAQLEALIDQLAQGAGGAAYRQHLVCRGGGAQATFFSPELRMVVQKLASAIPHCGQCPRCRLCNAGRVQRTCKLCGGRGWLTIAEFDHCTHQERQELQRLRAGSLGVACNANR
jgi:hypothetical protein